MTVADRLIKNTTYLYIKIAVSTIVSLYSTRLVLQALGANDFGIFNVIGGVIAMLGFLNSVMASATQRFVNYAEGTKDVERIKSIFNISVVLHVIVGMIVLLIFLLCFPFLDSIVNIPVERISAGRMVYICFIVSSFFTIVSVPCDAMILSHENMRYLAFIGIFESMLKLAVAVTIINSSVDRLILYSVLMSVIPLIRCSILWYYCLNKYEECVVKFSLFDKSVSKEMLSFAGWNFYSTSIAILTVNGQGIVLNNYFGTILNAAQGISNQIGGHLKLLSHNMMTAFNPIIGKSAGAQNEELYEKSVFKGAKFSLIMYSAVSIPFYIKSEELLELWLDEVPEWTNIFVKLIIVQYFVGISLQPLINALSAKGKIAGFSVISSCLNIIQLPLLIILYSYNYPPYYLYIISIFVGNVLQFPLIGYFLYRHSNISLLLYLKSCIMPVAGLTLIMSFILSMLNVYSVTASIAYIVVYIILVFSFVLALSFRLLLSNEERRIIVAFCGKIIHLK